MKKLILTLAILGASLFHAQVDTSKYDYVGAFYKGFARVQEGEKWYIIDTKGKKIKEVELPPTPILAVPSN